MASRQERNKNIGAAIIFLIFSLLFFTLLARFVYIQLTGEVKGEVLAAKAEQKYQSVKTLDSTRGSILDRSGEVIAEDILSFKLIAILDEKLTTNKKKPQHVVDPAMTAEKLAQFIDMDQEEIYEILTKENRMQVEFGRAGRDISNKIKSEIDQLDLPGITFIRDRKRFYPNGVFASHLIGFVEENEDSNGIGMLGLEKSMQQLLEGQDGKYTFKSDRYGLLLSNYQPEVIPAKNGNDIYLTIDKKIQTFLEDALDNTVEQFSPEKLIAIVADPKSGEILAMAQRPTFHPNSKVGLEKSWHNEIVETSFEPGSTMKVFTLAAAIEEGVFNPNETFLSGHYQVGPDRIHDHNRVGWGTISYLEGVQRSSNVGFSKLAMEKLGAETFYDYLLKFGFNKPTEVDLPNETSGKILYTYPIEKVTTSYGQGTTLTPIQQIQAMTAIANGGKMMKPQIIKKIVDRDNGEIIEEKESEVVDTPISAETATQVLDILETVVSSPNGTGKGYHIEGYEVAGKTGTAQMPGPDGRYLTGSNNYIFSFLGAVPKDDPQLIMYVAIQQPKLDGRVGSESISPLFKAVMKHSLQYLNIKPADLKKKESYKLPNLVGKQVENAKNELSELNYEVVVIGNGTKVVAQSQEENSRLLEGEKIILQTDGDVTIPDMTDWSLRDVLKVSKLAKLQFSKVGNGYATKQSIPPGAKVAEGDYLVVEFATPKEKLTNRDEVEVTDEMITN